MRALVELIWMQKNPRVRAVYWNQLIMTHGKKKAPIDSQPISA